VRIGVDISKAQPPRDGVGNYIYHLWRELLALDAPHQLKAYGLSTPIDRSWFEHEFADAVGNATLIEGVPTPDEIDLLHCTAFACPAGWSGPTVFTCHDLTFLTHPELHTVANRLGCLTGTLRALLLEATFLCVSRATAAVLGQELEVPDGRIRVVHSGVDRRFAHEGRESSVSRVRDRFGLEEGYVLSVGTLEPRKNLSRLLEAYAGLNDDVRRRHPLVLVGGQGWRHAQFEEQLARPGAPENIRLLGFVDDEDLVHLYRCAGVFAYPSIAEGFGFPVLEAMACGAPVVTSDTSSLPEVAGDAARLVNPFDVAELREAIRELLETPGAAADLRRRSIERAAQFSWRTTARGTVELYETAAGILSS
jgi:glycosyltransferase involved in cell wall biosynthesis